MAGGRSRFVLPGVMVSGLVALALQAGPLDPPAGPVAPAYKTLTEVEPRIALSAANTPGDADSVFKITQRGSYYLTGNITGVTGKTGIEIATGGVTLDLNGFSVIGAAGALDGIRGTAIGMIGVTIRNGSVSNWPQNGIEFGNSTSYIAESINAFQNGAVGIAGGFNGVIRNCTARSNTGVGIQGGDPTVIESCAAVFNGGAGIRARFGKSTITNCVCQINSGPGIQVADHCLVKGNQCSQNTGPGVLVEAASNRIEGNNIVAGASGGIRVTSTGNLIIGNSVAGGLPAYDFVTGNRYGQIVNIAAATGAAVSGATATSTLTTTDPWANFAY